MKKFVYIFTLSCLPIYNLYADKVTSGTIGLIKPTTGVIDTTRSWGDKINSNFDVIAGTLADVISGKALSPSSVTLQGNTFNGSNQLVQTNGNGQLLPSLISNLTFYLQNYSTGTNYIFNNSTFSILGGSVTIGNSFGLAIGTNVLVQGNGNVLLGSGVPTSLLDVNNGSITVRGANAGISINGSSVLDVSGSTQTKTGGLNVSGNVGIGTTGPLAKGDILAANAILDSPGTLLLRTSNAQAIDVGGQLSFGGYNNDAASAVSAWTSVSGRKENGTTGNNAGYLAFATALNGVAQTERMRITSAGNVGIGATGPSSLFDLNNGSITVRGTNSGIIIGTSPVATIPFTDGKYALIGSGGGGAVYTSTVAITLKFPGDIYQATSPFVAIQGAMFSTGRGTFNVVSIEASLIRQSTKSATFFQLWKTTATQNGAVGSGIATQISPNIAFTTSTGLEGDSYAVNVSTKFVCNAFERYALQVSSVTDPNLGGSPPNELQMLVWGWWKAWTLSP